MPPRVLLHHQRGSQLRVRLRDRARDGPQPRHRHASHVRRYCTILREATRQLLLESLLAFFQESIYYKSIVLLKRQMIPSIVHGQASVTCLSRHGARWGAGRGEHLRPLEPPDVPRAGAGQGDLVTLLRPGAGLLPHRARHQDTGGKKSLLLQAMFSQGRSYLKYFLRNI